MQSQLGHIQVNVKAKNIEFYKKLLAFLEWNVMYESDEFIGAVDKNGASVWFIGYANDAQNDYDGVGMNHLAFGVSAQSDVDKTVDYLREAGVALLFDTPRHREDFSQGEGQTYYQVMFESPDRVLFEVVYIGAKE
ncbi:MAG: VOC family protein [Caldilineaceae bacterium]|nr:VOC family protein [Caldilineaceae bacterium]